MSDMFEQAARLKLRFESPVGQLTVEDLWDLPLTSKTTNKPNLDDIARSIYKKIDDKGAISFVETHTKDARLQLSFEIVKHVIATVQAERAAAASAKERAETKQKILAIIDDRKNEELRKMPIAELEALLAK